MLVGTPSFQVVRLEHFTQVSVKHMENSGIPVLKDLFNQSRSCDFTAIHPESRQCHITVWDNNKYTMGKATVNTWAYAHSNQTKAEQSNQLKVSL